MRLFLLVLVVSLLCVLQDSKADTELNNPYVNNYPFKSVIIKYKNKVQYGHIGDEDNESYTGNEELYIKGDKSLRVTTKERPDEDGEKKTIKGMKLVTPEKEFVIDVDENEAIEIENPKKYGKVKFEELTEEEKIFTIKEAAIEVRKAAIFGEIIIGIVYIPILTLSGIEGKMFKPMPLTVL